jgi:hypothetical protein
MGVIFTARFAQQSVWTRNKSRPHYYLLKAKQNPSSILTESEHPAVILLAINPAQAM